MFQYLSSDLSDDVSDLFLILRSARLKIQPVKVTNLYLG